MANSVSDSPSFSESSWPLIENSTIIGCGYVTLDYLLSVDEFPTPNRKMRIKSLKVEGGGNIGNASTCAARLGLKPIIVSKVADDSPGQKILKELASDGIDTSLITVCKGYSPASYVIVDKKEKTRTCLYHGGSPPLIPDQVSWPGLFSAFHRARLVYFDGKMHKTAVMLAQEAHLRGIPILVDAERKKKGMDILLNRSSYVVCAAEFPQEWTGESSIAKALVSMAASLPNMKFVIVTLGEDGCIMLERSAIAEGDQFEEIDVDILLESLQKKKDNVTASPICISSSVVGLLANGVGTVSGKLLIGTAEKLLPSEVLDTTGAGDAFVGAILYAICSLMLPEKMLPFAAKVAACCCRSVGARSGLPLRSDPRIVPFLL